MVLEFRLIRSSVGERVGFWPSLCSALLAMALGWVSIRRQNGSKARMVRGSMEMTMDDFEFSIGVEF